ncbi:MAG: BspA family leucine-rich repeat surface protein [Muribaculaceae bacterium]|nr:BspA family leucine-rich repeat surface protein [Muribaculaceae bacterium]MBR5085779.1 BspA family leucine-rich repeat surface protein [Muribaculaceae bacterium]
MKKILLLLVTLMVGLVAQATVSTPILFRGMTRTGGNNSFCVWAVESNWGSDQQSQLPGSSYYFSNYVIHGNNSPATITLYGRLNFQEGTSPADVVTGNGFNVIIESSTLWFYGATVKTGSDATVTGCSVNVSSDKHTLTVTIPEGKTFGSITVNYVANEPFSSSNTVISGVEDDYLYQGEPIEPEPVVTYNGTVLTKGTDYTVSYVGSNSLGSATITVNGTGNYAGTIYKSYTLRDVDLRDFNSLGNNTYEIATTTDLDYLARYVKAGNYGNDCTGLTFLQTADIAYSYTTEWTNGGENNFTSVGVYSKPFNGTYDGQNHTVSGIRIFKTGTTTSDESQGLFGYVGGGGTVKKVILSNTHICGFKNTGGIVGYNSGTIEDCRVESNVLIKSVRATTSVGGIAGICAFGGTISRCTFKGTAEFMSSPSSDIGGIVGTLSNSTISNCLVLGAFISGDINYSGAIAGNKTGTLTANYYHNCMVAYSNNTNATVNVGVGLEGGHEDQDGARSVHALTLPSDVTASGETVTIDGVTYYASNTTVTLSYNGNEVLENFVVNGDTIEGATFVMPAADVVVEAAILARYTFNSETGELALLWGEFNKDHKWGSEVTPTAVKSVTATSEVSFTGDCSNLFNGLAVCESMDLNSVNTSEMTNCYRMFYWCAKLDTLDLSNWNTANVTDMSYMFYTCKALDLLNISNFGTGNVTNMSYMFYECNKLKTIFAGSGWNTESVTNSSYMFTHCLALVGGKGTAFDADHIDKEYARLDGGPDCPGYFTDVNDGPYVPRYTFDSKSGVLTLNWGEFNKDNKWGSEVTNYKVKSVIATSEVSFTGDCSELFAELHQCLSMDLENVNTSEMTNCYRMFYWCTKLDTLDLSNWNTANVTNMSYMFYNCNGLDLLNISNFDTGNVTDMSQMFGVCSALTSLDVSNWNTSNVTNMNNMFDNCKVLTSLDISDWNTVNVTTMKRMFSGCIGLTSLDLSDWNTSNVTDMSYMFFNCNVLTSLDLSDWNTSNVTDMSDMFYNCMVLTSLDISDWNTANVTNMNNMFGNCNGLTSLDLSDWNTSNVTDMSDMFFKCSSLTTIYAGAGWSTESVTNSNNMFYNCTSLVGGMGTTFDANLDDKRYARIDGGPDCPGYFTEKNASVPGDVNCDGSVTSADVTCIYNYLLSGDESFIDTCDVNNDGFITSADITVIYNILLGSK